MPTYANISNESKFRASVLARRLMADSRYYGFYGNFCPRLWVRKKKGLVLAPAMWGGGVNTESALGLGHVLSS